MTVATIRFCLSRPQTRGASALRMVQTCSMLLTAELRRALLKKCGQSFGAIFGHKTFHLPLDFLIQGALKRRAIGSKEPILHEICSQWRRRSELSRQRTRFFSQAFGGNDAVVDSDPPRFF